MSLTLIKQGMAFTSISQGVMSYIWLFYSFHISHHKLKWSRLECFWLSFLGLHSRHHLLQRFPSLHPSVGLCVEPCVWAAVTFCSSLLCNNKLSSNQWFQTWVSESVECFCLWADISWSWLGLFIGLSLRITMSYCQVGPHSQL